MAHLAQDKAIPYPQAKLRGLLLTAVQEYREAEV